MTYEMFMQLLGYVGAGAVVYAAIKADLARAIVLAEQAGKAASEAHGRIDKILTKG